MKFKTNKIRIIYTTLISTLFFCTLIVMSSLSPLANFGKHANRFGSIGMWTSIGIVLLIYLLPLIAYVLRVNSMKYVMAVIISIFNIAIIGISISVSMIIGKTKDNSTLIYILITCCITLIINIIWYFMAFRKSEL